MFSGLLKAQLFSGDALRDLEGFLLDTEKIIPSAAVCSHWTCVQFMNVTAAFRLRLHEEACHLPYRWCWFEIACDWVNSVKL